MKLAIFAALFALAVAQSTESAPEPAPEVQEAPAVDAVAAVEPVVVPAVEEPSVPIEAELSDPVPQPAVLPIRERKHRSPAEKLDRFFNEIPYTLAEVNEVAQVEGSVEERVAKIGALAETAVEKAFFEEAKQALQDRIQRSADAEEALSAVGHEAIKIRRTIDPLKQRLIAIDHQMDGAEKQKVLTVIDPLTFQPREEVHKKFAARPSRLAHILPFPSRTKDFAKPGFPGQVRPLTLPLALDRPLTKDLPKEAPVAQTFPAPGQLTKDLPKEAPVPQILPAPVQLTKDLPKEEPVAEAPESPAAPEVDPVAPEAAAVEAEKEVEATTVAV